MFKRVFLIIMDGVGAGAAPDASAFGDEGASTLCNLSRAEKLNLPTLLSLGLGNIEGLSKCFPPAMRPLAFFGRMLEASAGKDTTTGHWELMGVIRPAPPLTYPKGFPLEVVRALERKCGCSFIGNEAASGTEIIKRLGGKHLLTGALILYTSADSVMQIAAHEEVVPLGKLYGICMAARELMAGEWEVDRIIARPFNGDEKGGFTRTLNRRDFSIPPPPNFLDELIAEGINVTLVGKLDEIFAGRGYTRSHHTSSNADSALALQNDLGRSHGFWFANFIDFDMLHGHRNNTQGFAQALNVFDGWLGGFIKQLSPEDLLILTADHGNDPTTESTDHSREYVPLLAYVPSAQGSPLGTRKTFADAGATVLDAFGIAKPRGMAGESFYGSISPSP